MYGLSLNQDLLSLIEGKRVALVGPAPHLIGSGNGKLIDDYDIVIRVNRTCVPAEHRNDYGHRTDVLVHNLGAKYIGKLEEEIEIYPETFDAIKMGCCFATKCLGRERIHRMADNWVSPVVNHFKRINRNNVPFYWIGVPDYHKIWNECKQVEPNQGCVAMIVLAHYPVEELFITGFTFFQNSDTIEGTYYSGYNGGRVGGHGGQPEQMDAFRRCYHEAKDRIKLDSVLEKIIG